MCLSGAGPTSDIAPYQRRSNVRSGTVKWFNVTKVTALFRRMAAARMFVPIKAVQKAGLNGLVDGAKIAFDVITSRGKHAAETLRAKSYANADRDPDRASYGNVGTLPTQGLAASFQTRGAH